MTENVDSLILDLLARIGDEPRPYAEVMEAWRTSCPRLPVPLPLLFAFAPNGLSRD